MHKHKHSIITATWIGIFANIFLAILKAVGGVISGSRALIADALHSASDIASSIIVLFGVKIAHKPPDKEHPYGHGKAENIASVILALLLFIVGIEITVSSFKVILGEVPSAPGKLALIILVVSILIKEVLFQYKSRLGKKYNSTALISEAWHHRSDALSSLAAMVGVGFALIGDFLDIQLFIYGDAVAGVVVSIIVMKVGYSIARDSFNVVLEQVLDDKETKKFRDTVHAIDGVKTIDQLFARTHGSYVIIDIKISVNPNITVKKGHDIAAQTKKSLLDNHEEVEDVLVHINPFLGSQED